MLNLEWDIGTLILYIAIIFFTYILGLLSNRKTLSKVGNIYEYKLNRIYFTLAFLIFFIFSAIRSVGTDYKVYEDIFLSSNNKSDVSIFGIEPGFVLLNRVIHFFTSSAYVYFIIISFITIYFVFATFKKFHRELNLGIAFLVYSSLYYFQSYSLVRVYLVSSIILYSFSLLLEKKFLKYFFFLIISTTLHFSTVLLIFPLFGIYLYSKKKYLFYGFVFITIFACYKFSSYIILLNISERYTGYLENIDKNVSFGFAQFFIFLPILFFLYISRKQQLLENWTIDIFTVFTWSAFLFGMMGYWIPTIGRINYILTYPFILFLPFFLHALKGKKYYYLYYNFVILYLIIGIYTYFSALAFADGINSYSTIFNN